VGERSGWWAGFRAECLDWRLVGSWVDGWVKGWESKVVGFGWSGPKPERAIPPRSMASQNNSTVAPPFGEPHGPAIERRQSP